MAQIRWQGSDGNYDTAGNWSGGKPSAGTDDVIIPGTSAQAITSNADNENAVDTNSIFIERGYNQDIMSSGTPWYISTDLLVHQGGGTLAFKAGDAKIDVAVINATPASAGKLSASLSGDAAAADWGDLTIVRGSVDIEAVTFTIDRLTIGAVGNPASDVKVDCKAADGQITECYINGGIVLLSRPATTLVISGGRVIIDDYEPTTVHQFGGVVEYRTPTSSGTVTEWNLVGGILDVTKSSQAKSITTLNLFGSPQTTQYITDRYMTVTTLNDYRIAG